MDYLIKQMALLSESFRLFFQKVFARTELAPQMQRAWEHLKGLLDSHLYESMHILSFVHSLSFESAPILRSELLHHNKISPTAALLPQQVLHYHKEQQQNMSPSDNHLSEQHQHYPPLQQTVPTSSRNPVHDYIYHKESMPTFNPNTPLKGSPHSAMRSPPRTTATAATTTTTAALGGNSSPTVDRPRYGAAVITATTITASNNNNEANGGTYNLERRGSLSPPPLISTPSADYQPPLRSPRSPVAAGRLLSSEQIEKQSGSLPQNLLDLLQAVKKSIFEFEGGEYVVDRLAQQQHINSTNNYQPLDKKISRAREGHRFR